MLWTPAPPRFERLGTAAAGVSGVRGRPVISGASNAFGAWVFIGATSFAWAGFALDVQYSASRPVVLDIAVGRADGVVDAALEANLIVSKLAWGMGGATNQRARLPLAVRPGVGLYARVATTSTSAVVYCGLRGQGRVPGGHGGFALAEPLGAYASPASFGTGSVVADGAWQLVGIAARDYAAIAPMIGGGALAVGRNGSAPVAVNLALGTPAGVTLVNGAPALLEADILAVSTSQAALHTPEVIDAHVRVGAALWARLDLQIPTGTAAPAPNNATFAVGALGFA